MEKRKDARGNIAHKKLKLPQYKCQIKAYSQHISGSVNVKFKFNDHMPVTPHPIFVWSDIALLYML